MFGNIGRIKPPQPILAFRDTVIEPIAAVSASFRHRHAQTICAFAVAAVTSGNATAFILLLLTPVLHSQ